MHYFSERLLSLLCLYFSLSPGALSSPTERLDVVVLASLPGVLFGPHYSAQPHCLGYNFSAVLVMFFNSLVAWGPPLHHLRMTWGYLSS